MGTTIDNKVVEMRFDNKQFESNVKTSLGTIDKLNKSLKLDGASKGLEKVNATAKDFGSTGLGHAVEMVSSKFSALQVMGVTALANITNQAVNAGKRIVSALTIDPIKSGFSEYETQINAVQTILANTSSKGTTLQQVNAALAELNTYADKTIYNFTEMTRNIGTFTAAGVELDTSVQAIKGIANLAAVSGSTSQQASTAMYQLSQALSSGTVKLMDWNSVVNAGMGGQVFQDALKETARLHGIAIDDMIKSEGSFRETLQKGWLTSDVLTETLNKFTGDMSSAQLKQLGYTEEQIAEIEKLGKMANDAATKVKTFTQLFDTLKEAAQSGWTKTWQTIIGDFGEAKELLTEMSDTIGGLIGESADARNKVLTEGLSSGWKQLLEQGIADETGYKESINKVAESHGESLDKMIEDQKKLAEANGKTIDDEQAFAAVLKSGKISSDILTESLANLTEKTKGLSDEQLEELGYTRDQIDRLEELNESVKNGTISMDEFAKKMSMNSGRENLIEALRNSFESIMTVIKPIKEAFSEIFPPITGDKIYAVTERILELTNRVKEFLSSVKGQEFLSNLKSTFKGIFSVISIVVTIIKTAVQIIGTLIGKISGLGTGFLSTTAAIGDWLTKLKSSVDESNIFGKAVEKVSGFLQRAIDKIKEFGSAIKGKFSSPGVEKFASIMERIWEIAKKVGKKIVEVIGAIGKGLANAFRNGDIQTLLDTFNTGVLGMILLGIRKFISGAKGAFDGISGILGSVQGCFEEYQKKIKADVILKIAIAMGIMAVSLLLLASIDPERLSDALTAMVAALGSMIGALALLNKIDVNKSGISKIGTAMVKLAVSMLIIAFAMKIFADVCAKFEDISWEALGKAGAALGGVLALCVGFGVLSKYTKKVIKGAIALVIIGAAMEIFADVCSKFEKISWEGLGKSGAAIGGILALCAGFGMLSRWTKKVIKGAVALVIIGAAMEIFADVCSKFERMSWLGLAKSGAAIGGILILAAGFGMLSRWTKKVIKGSVALVVIGAAMEIFADVTKKFGQMEWEELAKAGAAIGGILILAAGFGMLSRWTKKVIKGAVALVIIGAAMEIFADVANKFAQMEWEGLAKAGTAIGGILLLAAGFGLLAGLSNGILKSAAALLVMAVALRIFVPVLQTLGSMSWEELLKGLGALAGAFVVLGLAGLVLKPVAGTLLLVSAAMLLFGIACVAIGAGMLLFAAGVAALATALGGGAAIIVSAITLIITNIVNLIPLIATRIGEAIVAFCGAIADGAVAIGDCIKTVLLTALDVISECIPAITDCLLKLLVDVLGSLVEYIPTIVNLIFDFIVKIIETATERIPELVVSIGKFFAALFGSIIEVLAGVDPDRMIKMVSAIGLLAGVVAEIAAVALLIPAAMIGAAGIGALLVPFAEDLKAFSDNVAGVDVAAVTAAAQAAQALALMAATIPNEGGVAAWFAGENSLAKFGTEIAEFGTNLKAFSDNVAGVDPVAITAAAEAAKALAVMADTIPNEGGVAAWFAGENSLSKFGTEMASFGANLKVFSDNVTGVDTASVTAAADAAVSIAAMADTIPNEGGVVGWFAGENSLAKFGTEMASFGANLKLFSDNVAGVDPASVTAAADAATSLATMADTIPNEGGVVGWFAGENSLAKFGTEVAGFGESLKLFSDNVSGVDPVAVTAAADAGKALAIMADTIPNEGGVVSWFAGENSLAKFGSEIADFGINLKAFSDNVAGVDPVAVTAAADAGKALAVMASTIPNSGGVAAWFAGENSLAKFGSEIAGFGSYLKEFSDNVTGIDVEAVTAASTAGQALADMAATIPNEGGVVGWFAGENSLAKFGSEIADFGTYMKSFSDNVTGIDVEAVTAASTAGKALADMAATIPNEGGVAAWFAGENSLAKFGTEIAEFGVHMKEFSDNVTGIDVEAVTAAATAGQALADMANTIPNSGGVTGWFSGDNSMAKFGTEIADFGICMKTFSDNVTGIDVAAVTAASTAGKELAAIADKVPNEGGVAAWFAGDNSLASFGSEIADFGKYLKTFSDNVVGIDVAAVTAATDAARVLGSLSLVNVDGLSSVASEIDNLINISDKIADVDYAAITSFGTALEEVAKNGISQFIAAFTGSYDKITAVGKVWTGRLVIGVTSGAKAIELAVSKIANNAAAAVKKNQINMKSAGQYLGEGLVSGIKAKETAVYNAGFNLGKKAVQGEKDGQQSKSPSKATIQSGKWLGEGLIIGIKRMGKAVYSTGYETGETAVKSISSAISTISSAVDSDIDSQPTIRPVMDLSDIQSGANTISDLLSAKRSVGVLANVGAINSMMNNRQNGVNDDVVSAISDLGKRLGRTGDTYNVNGVTYDDGSNISEAVKTLIRAARVERRV